MRRIEDEDVRPAFDKAWDDFCEADCLVRDYVNLAEHFFIAGYEAAIAERAKFDEQNKLIVKDIGEL